MLGEMLSLLWGRVKELVKLGDVGVLFAVMPENEASRKAEQKTKWELERKKGRGKLMTLFKFLNAAVVATKFNCFM